MRAVLKFLMAGVLALVVTRVASSRIRNIARRPRSGGIESPEITGGYLQVSDMPQMKLMRSFIARRALKGLQMGRALDLGSGAGQLAIEMALAAPGLAVIGLDLSDAMLELASARAREMGVGDRVAFVKGDADSVPYPDASFDLVTSTLSLHHWADPVAVFDEVARLLRPGGRFLIFDLRRDVGLPVWLLLWFATRRTAPAAVRREGEPMGSREAAYTPDEVVALLSGSSLRDWQVTEGPLWLTAESISH